MVVASEIPIDIWLLISANIGHPKYHIPLSQICQSSRAVYDGEDRWKQLCRSIGVGRGSVECREPWKKVFIEVVSHRERCKAPLCYQFGVPAMRSVGDLLTTPEALKDHFEYFREDNKCNCGRRHDCDIPSSDEESGGSEGEDDDDDDDEDSDDDGDEGEDEEEEDEDEWSDEQEEVADAFDDAAMASFFNYLGVPAPPGMGHNHAPLPGLGNPIPGYGNPNGAPGYHPLANTPLGAAPTSIGDMINSLFGPGMGLNDQLPPPSPPKTTKNPKVPKVEIVPKSKLLPLALKNLAHVPPRPILHPLLADTGSIQFQRFLDGKMALHPCTAGPNLTGMATSTMTGMDWDVEENCSDDEKDPNIEDIEEHALIARAFATNPPVVDLRIIIDSFETKIYNSDGVTIRDVIHKLNRFLRKPLSTKEKQDICGVPHVGCHLDTFATRLAYLLREYPPCGPEQKLEGVKQCWISGILDVRAWCAVCVLCPSVPPPT